jgi:hypothetical protein
VIDLAKLCAVSIAFFVAIFALAMVAEVRRGEWLGCLATAGLVAIMVGSVVVASGLDISPWLW